MAPSQHDWKIVYRDVKQQQNKQILTNIKSVELMNLVGTHQQQEETLKIGFLRKRLWLVGWLVGWLCWCLMSLSTIFQSCQDGSSHRFLGITSTFGWVNVSCSRTQICGGRYQIPRPLAPESKSLPLSHCSPLWKVDSFARLPLFCGQIYHRSLIKLYFGPCNHTYVWTIRPNYRQMLPKDADWMINS